MVGAGGVEPPSSSCQQTTGNRCAGGRFPRSRATVGVEVKCSLSRAAIPLPSRTPFRFPDPVTCSTPPSTCTSAHNQCYFSTHQHSRTNPTPHTSPSVVPLPSSRTLQLQHTTAVHRRCLCWQVLRSSAASWASEHHRHLGHPRTARRRVDWATDSPVANLLPIRLSRCARRRIWLQGSNIPMPPIAPDGRTRGVLDQLRSVVLWQISGMQRR